MTRIQKQASGFGVRTETTLFTQAQAGCADSLNELMKQHEGLVHLVVRRQWVQPQSAGNN